MRAVVGLGTAGETTIVPPTGSRFNIATIPILWLPRPGLIYASGTPPKQPFRSQLLFDKSVIILVVSREILEGSVVDRNAAFIANRIDDIGYRVRTIQVVDRVEAEMVATMSWAIEQKPTFVLVTGGMGPNWDDNTRGCLAQAAGLQLEDNPEAFEFVQNAYRRLFAKQVVRQPDMTDSRKGMAMLPKGAKCYENTVGTAPAVQLEHGPTTVFLLPGVPAEMQRFFTSHVMPVMAAAGPDTVRGERTVDYHGHDESSISRVLADISAKHPKISLRTRVQGTMMARTIRIVLVAEQDDAVQLNELLEQAEQDLRDRLGLEFDTPPTDASRLGD